MEFDETQQLAVKECLSDKNIVAVTGPAGSGKTTIIRAVCDSIDDRDVILCAPTGKAARRMTEVTGYPALTVHKLLEFPNPKEVDPKTGKSLDPTRPKRHERYPLDFDFIVLDEAAMVNRQLYTDLINAIPRGGKLRMFGDINQLPPIEENQFGAIQGDTPFFSALYKRLPNGLETKGVVLDKIHRQGEGSGIVKNGLAIIKGMYPSRYPDFRLHPTKFHTTLLLDLLDNVDYSTLNNQIIVPGNKGWLGTKKLNAILQAKLNPSFMQHGMKVARHKWDTTDLYLAPGDKVINTKNQYDIGINGVMNGETGIVKEITEWQEILIDFGEEVISFPTEIVSEYAGVVFERNPQKDLDLAYAITTHKSQGSEYQNVVYMIDGCHNYVLNRHNFYTGVTRARQAVDCVFDTRAMPRALAKESMVFKSKG